MKSGIKNVFQSTDTTNNSTLDLEGAGTVYRDNAGNEYRWVKNSSGAALAIGSAVFHGTGNTLGYFAEVFKLGQSQKGTAIDLLAGVAMSAIPSASYGWIQTKGYGSVSVDNTTTVVVGDSLKGVSGQYYMTRDTIGGTAAPTAGLRGIVVLSTSTVSGTVTLNGDVR